LAWLGHVIRLDETRCVKKIFAGKLGGGRGRGRPKLRRINDVEGWCETMENEGIGKSGMGINYKGSQGQTERAVVL
jgi:hypothetical protein